MTKAGFPITKEGVDNAQSLISINAAKFWAVMTVESRGFGFLNDRRPKILFERHVFHRLTNGKFSGSHPGISNKKAGGYGVGGKHQYERLEEAKKLDPHAALESASWGVGQVMGFNAAKAGFQTVETMVEKMAQTEDAQMLGMFEFIKAEGLGKFLKNEQWEEFAKRYNGSGYKANKYHIKLSQSHNLYKSRPAPDLQVRLLQTSLAYLGFNPGGIDGIYGQNTQKALIRYQKSKNLPQDGEVSDAIVDMAAQDAFN